MRNVQRFADFRYELRFRRIFLPQAVIDARRLDPTGRSRVG